MSKTDQPLDFSGSSRVRATVPISVRTNWSRPVDPKRPRGSPSPSIVLAIRALFMGGRGLRGILFVLAPILPRARKS